MVMYVSIILVSMAIISVLNIFLGTVSFGYTPIQVVGLVCLSVVAEIVIDLILAGIVHAMPSSWFDPEKKCFCVGKKERKFYEKLGIKSWKDKVLELGALGGFRKNKIQDGANTEYFNTFLIESNKGIITHILNIILGFLVIFCIPLKYWLVISIPVAIVNSFLGMLPIFILRYNIPKLKVALQRAQRQNKQKETV
jgi:hypothetical protein